MKRAKKLRPMKGRNAQKSALPRSAIPEGYLDPNSAGLGGGQVQATFDVNVSAYLKDLHASGLYGATLGEVVDGLVCAGIREALHSEHIKRRTFGKRRA